MFLLSWSLFGSALSCRKIHSRLYRKTKQKSQHHRTVWRASRTTPPLINKSLDRLMDFESISHVHHIFIHLRLLSYITQLSKLPTFRRNRPSKEWRSLGKRTAFNWVHSVPSIREGFTRIEDFAHCTYCLTKLMLIRMIDWSTPAVRLESNITLPDAFASAFVCITPGSKQNSGMMHRNEEIKSGPSLPKEGCNAGGHRHGMPMLLATYQLRPWENSPQKQQLRSSVQCDGNATCLEFTGTVWIARLKATKCCVYTGLLQIETSDSAH